MIFETTKIESIISGVQPSENDFVRDAASHDVVPVWIELVSDSETPLSVLAKIGRDAPSFLLESAEQNDLVGRHSFVGSGARAVIKSTGDRISLTDVSGRETNWTAADPLKELQAIMDRYRCAPNPELPGFSGGAVGYLGYEAANRFEPSIPKSSNDDLQVPDMLFFIADTEVAFDHRKRRIKVIACAFPSELGLERSREEAIARIARVVEKLGHSSDLPLFPVGSPGVSLSIASNLSREGFENAVDVSKEYIKSGDIFQVVLSQRFAIPYDGDALHLYRALRFINPSPYMFCLRLPGGFSLVGSSPEVHVKVTGDHVQIRPIAGTRKRGISPEADAALGNELLNDPKECAEHLMLVDLARNDLGRISKFGSVSLTDFMKVERYSHVMHLVSNVVGNLSGKHNPLDVLRATFPAGTVSGSPKVRAMQIISSLEPTARGTYAGAVGYLGFNGILDSCIALRTVLLKNGTAYVQAGAGIVADSKPDAEFEETVNKAMGVIRAIELAVATSPKGN